MGWINATLPPLSWGYDGPFPLKILVRFIICLISFFVGIISWKCETCSSCVEIYPEMGTICSVTGSNSTKFSRAAWMDFIPLANRNIFWSSNLLKKMGLKLPVRSSLSIRIKQCSLTTSLFFQRHLCFSWVNMRGCNIFGTCRRSFKSERSNSGPTIKATGTPHFTSSKSIFTLNMIFSFQE